jgi:hypothetical protein
MDAIRDRKDGDNPNSIHVLTMRIKQLEGDRHAFQARIRELLERAEVAEADAIRRTDLLNDALDRAERAEARADMELRYHAEANNALVEEREARERAEAERDQWKRADEGCRVELDLERAKRERAEAALRGLLEAAGPYLALGAETNMLKKAAAEARAIVEGK